MMCYNLGHPNHQVGSAVCFIKALMNGLPNIMMIMVGH